jgi:hypothetical protein
MSDPPIQEKGGRNTVLYGFNFSPFFQVARDHPGGLAKNAIPIDRDLIEQQVLDDLVDRLVDNKLRRLGINNINPILKSIKEGAHDGRLALPLQSGVDRSRLIVHEGQEYDIPMNLQPVTKYVEKLPHKTVGKSLDIPMTG